MNLEALKQTLESLDINPDEIEDEIYAKVFRILFAIIEILSKEIDALKSENQKLRDEIKLLKGEQTKPKIRGSKKNDDISSENERRERNPRKSRESSSRKDKIKIHHTETCRVDSLFSVLYQLDQKIIYPHYDFKHLTEKYFEIGMKLRNDKNIISSISVTDIVFDDYLGKSNYRAVPKVKT